MSMTQAFFEKFDAVFFDIDGTLVNIFPIHTQSYRRAFQKITGIDEPNPDFFLQLYNLGNESAVWKRALELKKISPTPELIEKLTKLRPLEFEKLLSGISTADVLPGVLQTLQSIQKQGKRQVVFSGNTRKIGELILQKTGLREFFERDFFSTDSPLIKDKKTLFAFALQQTNISASTALIVEDTPNGVLAAQKLGISVLVVATGIHSVEELRGLKYGTVVSSLE